MRSVDIGGAEFPYRIDLYGATAPQRGRTGARKRPYRRGDGNDGGRPDAGTDHAASGKYHIPRNCRAVPDLLEQLSAGCGRQTAANWDGLAARFERISQRWR